MTKIFTDHRKLNKVLDSHRDKGNKIAFTNGCFDLLHPGHVEILNYASEFGVLVVGVNDDASVHKLKGLGRPVNSIKDRMAILAGLAAVDYVVSFSGDTPQALVELITPNTLIKGVDYRDKFIAGADHVKNNGGRVCLYDLIEGKSTTGTIQAIRGKVCG